MKQTVPSDNQPHTIPVSERKQYEKFLRNEGEIIKTIRAECREREKGR
jgi:hypothetical protein